MPYPNNIANWSFFIVSFFLWDKTRGAAQVWMWVLVHVVVVLALVSFTYSLWQKHLIAGLYFLCTLRMFANL